MKCSIMLHFIWVLNVFRSFPKYKGLTLKAPITTAADNKFYYIFPNFRKKK